MNNTYKTEFGIYRIDKDYINYLRTVEPHVIDPEITNWYCGPVCRKNGNRGEVEYFVPIDIQKYNKKNSFLMGFLNGVLAGIMDFKGMIPCLPDKYTKETSNEDLVNFCISSKEQIENCAKYMMYGEK